MPPPVIEWKKKTHTHTVLKSDEFGLRSADGSENILAKKNGTAPLSYHASTVVQVVLSPFFGQSYSYCRMFLKVITHDNKSLVSIYCGGHHPWSICYVFVGIDWFYSWKLPGIWIRGDEIFIYFVNSGRRNDDWSGKHAEIHCLSVCLCIRPHSGWWLFIFQILSASCFIFCLPIFPLPLDQLRPTTLRTLFPPTKKHRSHLLPKASKFNPVILTINTASW